MNGSDDEPHKPETSVVMVEVGETQAEEGLGASQKDESSQVLDLPRQGGDFAGYGSQPQRPPDKLPELYEVQPCWICMDAGENDAWKKKLIRPCLCNSWVHQGCLQSWRYHTQNPRFAFQCVNCLEPDAAVLPAPCLAVLPGAADVHWCLRRGVVAALVGAREFFSSCGARAVA